MAQSVRNYVNNLDKIEEVVSDNADNILKAIDLDEFLKDPKKYLLLLGDAFLSEHIDELEQASKEGSRFASEVLKNR